MKSTKRVDKHRKAEKGKGRVRREYSATPDEHCRLRERLQELRKNER